MKWTESSEFRLVCRILVFIFAIQGVSPVTFGFEQTPLVVMKPSAAAVKAWQVLSGIGEILSAIPDVFVSDAHAQIITPSPDDLNETIDAKFTQAIQDQAAALDGDPVKMFNWVRNTIQVVPSYGSILGADLCLTRKACNPFDTASLLIALYRVSNIPAHYVQGTIRVPIAEAQQWFGGTTPQETLDALAGGKVPVSFVTDAADTVTAIQMDHMWVEVFVDYMPSRAEIEKQGDHFVTVDPSFKTTDAQGAIEPKEFSVLLGTLPYEVIKVEQEWAALPSSLRPGADLPTAEITGLVDIGGGQFEVEGTADDINFVMYQLDYRPKGSGVFIPLTSSTNGIQDGLLGIFDSTILVRGLYEIKLTATDSFGATTTTFFTHEVKGQLKIGNFSLSFTDLSVNALGIPIFITRLYESFNKAEGSFGVGWSLSLSDIKLQENFDRSVFLTLPNGRRVRFGFSLEGLNLLYAQAKWNPEPGVDNQLQMLGNNQVLFDFHGGFPIGFVEGLGVPYECFEPEGYILTLADGTTVTIKKDFLGNQQHVDPPCGKDYFGPVYGEARLTTIEGPNGNKLTFTSNGITHSSGQQVIFERDGAGRIKKITDPELGFVTYTYDANGDLKFFRDQEGQTTEYKYDSLHNLTEIIAPDQADHPIRVEYENGRIVATTDGDGNRIEIDHDLNTKQEIIRDPFGNPTIYEYDDSGNVVSLTNAASEKWEFIYNSSGQLINSVDPLGNSTVYTYDTNGNLASKTEPHRQSESPENFRTTYTYNIRGQRTSITFPSGGKIQFEFDPLVHEIKTVKDENGNVLASFDYLPNGLLTKEDYSFSRIQYKYDSTGNLIELLDESGLAAAHYDRNGRLLQYQAPTDSGHFTYDRLNRIQFADYGGSLTATYSYGATENWTTLEIPTFGKIERSFNNSGQITGWTLPDGRKMSFSYSGGRLEKQIDPLGNETMYSFDPAGRLTKVTDSTGKQELKYDKAGRVIESIDKLNHSTFQTYTPSGRLETLRDARNNEWHFRYTPRETTTIDPLGRESKVRYSPHGLILDLTQPDGAKTSFTYLGVSPINDANERITSVTDQAGRIRNYTYDEGGDIQTSTDLGGNLYTHILEDSKVMHIGPTGEKLVNEYDVFGRLLKVTFPDEGEKIFNFNSEGDLSSESFPDGTSVSYEYDSGGRLAERRPSIGSAETFIWNKNGLIESTSNSIGSTQFEYDDTGNLSSINYPDGFNVNYVRNALGHATEVTVGSNTPELDYTTKYDYDEVGNVSQITDPLDGVTELIYNEVNLLVRRTLPNGVTTVYQYNDRNQPVSIVHQNASGEVLVSVEYDREGIGEPRRITREDGSYVELTYDSAFRLTGETYFDQSGTLKERVTYAYDKAGNRQVRNDELGEQVYQYEKGYKLVETNGVQGNETFTYDAIGRMNSIARGASNWILRYDTEDQLTSVQSAQNNEGIVEYAYDAQGHRVKTSAGSNLRTTIFGPTLGGGLDVPHLISTQAGNIGYVFMGEQPLMRFGLGTSLYYLTDAMGSVIGLVDEKGELVAQFRYDGFGNTRTSIGPNRDLPTTAGGDFRFQSGWQDGTTGLYHFRARDYDPQTGRFLTRDPIEGNLYEPESFNPYNFGYSNPHVYRDPTGTTSLMDLLVSLNINSILKRTSALALSRAKKELVDQIAAEVGNLAIKAITQLFPGIPGQATILDLQPDIFKRGNKLEEILVDKFCKVAAGLVPGEFIWLEPRVTRRGVPLATGIGCDERTSRQLGASGTKSLLKKRFGGSRSGVGEPDFALSLHPLQEEKDGRGLWTGSESNPIRSNYAWVIGDVKFSASAAYHSTIKKKGKLRSQWRAMTNFAFRFEMIPIVIYLVWKGSELYERRLFGRGLRARPKAIVKVVPLLRK